MGKGDKKTKRGKIIMGSYGVRRPKTKNNLSKIEIEKKVKEAAKKKAKVKPVAEKKPVEKKPVEKKGT